MSKPYSSAVFLHCFVNLGSKSDNEIDNKDRQISTRDEIMSSKNTMLAKVVMEKEQVELSMDQVIAAKDQELEAKNEEIHRLMSLLAAAGCSSPLSPSTLPPPSSQLP